MTLTFRYICVQTRRRAALLLGAVCQPIVQLFCLIVVSAFSGALAAFAVGTTLPSITMAFTGVGALLLECNATRIHYGHDPLPGRAHQRKHDLACKSLNRRLRRCHSESSNRDSGSQRRAHKRERCTREQFLIDRLAAGCWVHCTRVA
jgi:hypothetical protein